MPFTISHPVAAIPFRKLGLPLSGLIIGSMMPDFEFFLSMSDERFIGHTLHGIFLFCIPVGLLLLLAYHKFLKYPLISLLPQDHQVRLLPYAYNFKFFPLSNLLKILISLMLGTISHLFLDALTHNDGFFAILFPFLKTPILYFPFGTVRVYFLFQYLLSILGLVIMVWAYHQWYLKTEREWNKPILMFSREQKGFIILAFILFVISVSLISGLISIASQAEISGLKLFKQFICSSVITACTSFLFALFVYSIGWHIKIPKDQRHRITAFLLKKNTVPAD